MSGFPSQLQIAFTNMDLINGSLMGYWPIQVEKGWAKVHGA